MSKKNELDSVNPQENNPGSQPEKITDLPKVPALDFSKIGNLNAIEKIDPSMAENIKTKSSSTISTKRKNSRFNFVQPELIPLPSKGKLYGNVSKDPDILNGFIRMYPMTLTEEEILSTQRFLRTGSATRMIFENCIASDIEAKDILLFDSNMLMFYLRQISYGDEYTFGVKCLNKMCNKDFKHTIKISEINFDSLNEDIKEPIEITLPVSKYTVGFVLPRMFHSEAIYMRSAQRKIKEDESSNRILDNFIVTTIFVKDTSGKEVPMSLWEEFYKSLPSLDRSFITDKTTLNTGFDELHGIYCPYCEREYEGTIPVGVEFFRL